MLGWFSPTVFVITEQDCDCLVDVSLPEWQKQNEIFWVTGEPENNHYFEKLKGNSLKKDVLQIFFKLGTIDSHFYDTVIEKLQTRELA